MGRAPPRLLLALMRLGRDGLIPGRTSNFLPLLALIGLGRDGLIPGRKGPSYFLPKVDFLRLGLDGAEPPGAANFLPLGLLPGFGRGLLSVTFGLAVTLPLPIILAFGLGRRRFGVIVFPRPGTIRLIFKSFIWN